jgi:hypothetical protein
MDAHRLANALTDRDPCFYVRGGWIIEHLRNLERADVVVALTYRGQTETTMGTIGWALASGKPVIWIHGANARSRSVWDTHPLVTRIEVGDLLRRTDEIAAAVRGALVDAGAQLDASESRPPPKSPISWVASLQPSDCAKTA